MAWGLSTWCNGKYEGNTFSILSSPFLSRRLLLGYRLISCLLLTLSIAAGIASYNRIPYFIYLTNWMALLNCLYFAFSTVALLSPSPTCKAAYILNEICIPNSIMVCIIYWTSVYPYIPKGSLTPFKLFQDITHHFITLLLLLVDYLFARTKFKLSHVYWPAIIICYLPVNAYYTITRERIYPTLSYQDFNTALYLAASVIISLGSFVAITCIILKYKQPSGEETLHQKPSLV